MTTDPVRIVVIGASRWAPREKRGRDGASRVI